MPRLKEISRAQIRDAAIQDMFQRLFGDRDPTLDPGTMTGTSGNWWTVFANSEETLQTALSGFNYYLSSPRKLDPKLRELGQTRAGWLVGSQFVFSQHCKSLRGNGVAEAKIAALPHWQIADVYEPAERAVLAYTDYLVGERGRVPDAVFDALRATLSDEEILELTYITTMYAMHATIARALRLEYDDREDPVVEIAAPENFAGRDFMGVGPKD
jgi:alkylhydroperoxidase family enzyme